MDSPDSFIFQNSYSSQSQCFTNSNEIGKIKEMLLSGNKKQITCAAIKVLSEINDNSRAVEMINSDICEFLCNAMLPFDSDITRTIYECLAAMAKLEEFFAQNHSYNAIESVIQSMNFFIKNGAHGSIVRYPLQTLELIVRGHIDFNITPESSFGNLTDLLIDLLTENYVKGVEYQTGQIINSLLYIDLRNSHNINNLLNVCDKWFDAICVKNDHSQYTQEQLVNLGCEVTQHTLSYIRKKHGITSHMKKNKDLQSIWASNLVKNIITFLLELSSPYIEIRPHAIEEQEIQRLEYYFMSMNFIFKNSPQRKLVAHKLSKMGYLQVISNILCLSHGNRYRKLGEICKTVLTEILLSLSDDVFDFPLMWPNGWDHFSNEIIKGMSLISLDTAQWADNLIEKDLNSSARLALIIYFFFQFLTAKSPAFSEGVNSSMMKLVSTSLGTDSPLLQIKVVWFIFVTLQMSGDPSSPAFNNAEFKKLLGILGSQTNFSLIYTHHPVLLSWAFSSSVINCTIQCEVMKLWLENRSADCTALDDFVKKSSNVRLVLFEILQNGDEHLTHSAFIILKNFMLQSQDDAISYNIWFILPQTLAKYAAGTINVIKVDYIIELANLRVPENPDMCKIVQIASLLPEALEKTDLISLTSVLKLALELLQMPVRYEDSRVLSAFLRCESFMQKIVSAMDTNTTEIAVTSLKLITILWNKPLNSTSLHYQYKKITLDAHSILKILNSTDLEVVKMGLVLLEQMLLSEFQSRLFSVQGVSSDLMKIIFFDLENILIKYLPLISGRAWICLKHCLLLRNQASFFAEDVLLHEVIPYGLPYLKDTPEMVDFLIVWIERRKEREKFCCGYRPIKESYFMETVRKIGVALTENGFDNAECLCQKVLECCDHFLIDTNQIPFNKLRPGTNCLKKE